MDATTLTAQWMLTQEAATYTLHKGWMHIQALKVKALRKCLKPDLCYYFFNHHHGSTSINAISQTLM